MLLRTLIASALILTLTGLALAAPSDAVTEGRLDAIGPEGRALGPCPLKHTDVDVAISGMIARVTVTQQFHNPFADKIEAVYVFPLHEDSAVDAMTMKVGDRIVRGVIKERGEAKRIYEQAKAAGKVASLLDQERPNIFTQSVANIEPGEQVTITIEYSQTLAWEDGRYSFDFPTVVGPRYIPGAANLEAVIERLDPPASDRVNPHTVKPTAQVPDADRITPPVIEEGMRAGHDISIRVSLDAGLPVRELNSEQHEVDVNYLDDGRSRARIALRDKDAIPNRDFALTWQTAQAKITDAVLAHTDERGRFFTLILQPPDRVQRAQIVPRELIFVLDTSGSMRGFPLDTSKTIMRRAIRSLRPRDRFNIITFAGNTAMLFEHAVANTEDNRDHALRFVDSLAGAGGTEMMKAIHEALGGEHDANTVRIVCFLTDGYVGNDMAIIDAVKQHAGVSRVFSFGIGSSVNRFLMDQMATAGRGEATFVLNAEQASEAAQKFYEHIDAPVLTDIEIDFGGLPVEEVYPRCVEDLFASRPVVVKGRYRQGGEGVITLKGRTAEGRFERPIVVNLPAEQDQHDVLASQWARAKVDDLMMRDYRGAQQGNMDAALKQQIIDLGLEYHLLTQFTSFVAVEEVHITEGGAARTIRVPVEMPQGVSYEGVFGQQRRQMNAPMSMPAAPGLAGLSVKQMSTDGISARFYGTGGNATKIIYVIDASGSMGDIMHLVIHRLKWSISQLSDHTRFTIIFFQDGAAVEVPPAGLKTATDDVKLSVAKWLTEAGHITPRGATDPAVALKLAFAQKPDVVFVLSDGLGGETRPRVNREELLKLLDDLNKDRKVKINAIDCVRTGPDGTTSEIAKMHGGYYKLITKQELMNPEK